MINRTAINRIKSEMVLVTPSMAQEYLKHNTHNRNVQENQVNRIATDMTAGRWYVTHQGIAFATDGSVLDGQHRLLALIKSNTSQWMMVTTGLPREAMSAIDLEVAVRSVGDVLSIAHDRDMHGRSRMVAAAMWVATGIGVAKIKRSKQEQIAFYLRNEEALQWAVSVFPTKTHGLGRAPVLGVIARAYYTADRDRVTRFCEVLNDGIPRNRNEETIILLRDWLLGGFQGGSAGAWSSASEAYKKTSRALHAYLTGERLGKLYAASEDYFPLPRDKDDVPTKKPGLRAVG